MNCRDCGKSPGREYKPPTIEILQRREELAALFYRYLGIVKKPGIAVYTREGCKRLEHAFARAVSAQMGGIEVPARFELFQGRPILFHLKDGMEKEVSCIPYCIRTEGRGENGYGELRIFIYGDCENWGFSVLEIAREETRLYTCPPGFVPFGPGAWETDVF